MTHSQETPDQSQKAEPLPETREPLKAYQRLSEKIQDAIEKGGLKVGDKLPPERTLAETFGVSRNSVREAIRTLSEQGILKSRHGDGTYICGSDLAPLTAALLNAVDTEGKSFDHIMEFRLVIEPSIARIATARHSAEQLHQLKIIVCDQQLKLLHGENDGDWTPNSIPSWRRRPETRFRRHCQPSERALFHNRADDVRLKRRMEEAINEHLMIIDALNARMRKPAPTRWRAISMPWRKSIFWRSPGKGGAHVDRHRRARIRRPLPPSSPTSLFPAFLSFPSSRFLRGASAIFPHAR